jgi:uncharacterized protein YecE (DUF72 family)
MSHQAQQGFIFFNNHVAAQAPKNAAAMVDLLRGYGLQVNNENSLDPDTSRTMTKKTV